VAQQNSQYFYFSHLLRMRVRHEGDPRPFGRLADIGVVKTAPYPAAVSLEFETRKGNVIWPWTAVVGLDPPREMVVKSEAGPAPAAEFWLRRDVLDDQVVDFSGARVRRVNDIHLLYAQGQLVVGHADVGTLGILRRLGMEKFVSGLLRWFFDYTIKDKFVTWRNLEVISPGPLPGGVRMSGEPSRLDEIHPAELADIMESLGTKERQALFSRLPLETAAEALQETDPEVQRTLVSRAEPAKAADILEEMDAKDAADVLRDLYGPDAEQIISRMEQDAAHDVKAILAQEEETAGAVMTTACIEARPEQKAQEVFERVRSLADEVEVLNTIYVLDEKRRLRGVLSLRDLLKAPPETTLEYIMTTHVVTLSPETGLTNVAELFAKYGFHSIPVVDKDNAFLGAVRFKSIRDQLAPLLRKQH